MKKVRILLPALLATILLMMVLPADAMPRNLHGGMATEQRDGLTDPAQEKQQEKTIFKDALGSMHIACPRPAKVVPPSGSHPGKSQARHDMQLAPRFHSLLLAVWASHHIIVQPWQYSRHHFVIALRHILC